MCLEEGRERGPGVVRDVVVLQAVDEGEGSVDGAVALPGLPVGDGVQDSILLGRVVYD